MTRKKIIGIVSCVLVLCLVVVMTTFDGRPTSVAVSYSFYLVYAATPENEISAVAYSDSVKNSGGAGYVLSYKGSYYCIVSAYPSLQDATSVCQALGNDSMKILTISIFSLSVPNEKEGTDVKETGDALVDRATTLYRTANQLEKGAVTNTVAYEYVMDCYRFLSSIDTDYREARSSVMKTIASCEDVLYGTIVKARDLRYLQIALIDLLLNL